MSSLVQNDVVIYTGSIVDSRSYYEINGSIFSYAQIPNAFVIEEEPPTEGNWLYIDGVFSRDIGQVPNVVTPRQARIALALQPATDPAFTTLLAQVEASFASLPEPDKTIASITWEYSTEVQRSNPLIAQMQAIISYTDEQIDDLFVLAASL